MAGRLSLALARRQGATLSCEDYQEQEDQLPRRPANGYLNEARGGKKWKVVRVSSRALFSTADLAAPMPPADAPAPDDFAKGPGWITNPRATRRLMNYWSHGKGAAKIAWGTDGAMRRCIKRLRKYFPQNPGGLCANLHHRATGEWPRGGVIPS